MAETLIPEWTINDRLVKARECRGWSQTDLADRLGVHRRTVVRREQDTDPKLEYVYAVAAVTGVDADWLLGRSDHIRYNTDSIGYHMPHLALDFAQAA